MKVIPIVYSTDNNMVDLCSVSIASVIANSSKQNLYNIYVLNYRLSKKNINNLEKMSTKNVIIKCIDVKKYIDFSQLYELQRYPYEIYFRLYISLILDYDKVIYLDCDTLVLSDIVSLYREKVDTSIGCVADYCYYTGGNFYFNSGVLIINKAVFEKNRVRNRCLNLIKERKFKFPDQDALNFVCKNDYTELNPKYNYQIHEAYVSKFRMHVDLKYKDKFEFVPVVVHYSYLTKPHKSILSIYNKDFWKYAKKTSYYEQLVDNYLFNPSEIFKNSFLSEGYLNEVYDGKVGLSGIIKVFLKSFVYWLLYKIRGGKND